MGRCNDNSKAVDLQKQQSIHPRQQGVYSKTRTISSIVPCTQMNCTQGKANYNKMAERELRRSQPKGNQHLC